MFSLNVAGVEVVVGKNATAYRTDKNSSVFDAKLIDYFTNKFVHDAMATAWATSSSVTMRQ